MLDRDRGVWLFEVPLGGAWRAAARMAGGEIVDDYFGFAGAWPPWGRWVPAFSSPPFCLPSLPRGGAPKAGEYALTIFGGKPRHVRVVGNEVVLDGVPLPAREAERLLAHVAAGRAELAPAALSKSSPTAAREDNVDSSDMEVPGLLSLRGLRASPGSGAFLVVVVPPPLAAWGRPAACWAGARQGCEAAAVRSGAARTRFAAVAIPASDRGEALALARQVRAAVLALSPWPDGAGVSAIAAVADSAESAVTLSDQLRGLPAAPGFTLIPSAL